MSERRLNFVFFFSLNEFLLKVQLSNKINFDIWYPPRSEASICVVHYVVKCQTELWRINLSTYLKTVQLKKSKKTTEAKLIYNAHSFTVCPDQKKGVEASCSTLLYVLQITVIFWIKGPCWMYHIVANDFGVVIPFRLEALNNICRHFYVQRIPPKNLL